LLSSYAGTNIAETLLPNASPLNQAIKSDPDWKKVYQDDDFSVSVRKSD